jgi:hypothetical protein
MHTRRHVCIHLLRHIMRVHIWACMDGGVVYTHRYERAFRAVNVVKSIVVADCISYEMWCVAVYLKVEYVASSWIIKITHAHTYILHTHARIHTSVCTVVFVASTFSTVCCTHSNTRSSVNLGCVSSGPESAWCLYLCVWERKREFKPILKKYETSHTCTLTKSPSHTKIIPGMPWSQPIAMCAWVMCICNVLCIDVDAVHYTHECNEVLQCVDTSAVCVIGSNEECEKERVFTVVCMYVCVRVSVFVFTAYTNHTHTHVLD